MSAVLSQNRHTLLMCRDILNVDPPGREPQGFGDLLRVGVTTGLGDDLPSVVVHDQILVVGVAGAVGVEIRNTYQR